MNNDINGEKSGSHVASENFALIAGGLAHDYNNMLTAMLGNIDLILCEEISDSVRETAEDIKSMMLKSSTLVRRMLSCASLAEPQNEKIDLNILVRDLVRIIHKGIPENATVSIEPLSRVPVICADTTMVWQIVMNLVINSCNALQGNVGFVKIAVEHRVMDESKLSGYLCEKPLPYGDYVELIVTDSGCGIDENVINQIFDPFFTTRKDGNGLGLPSVRSIVFSYSGGIKVESERGKGTTFRILLPAYRNEDGNILFCDGLGPALQPVAKPSVETISSPVKPAEEKATASVVASAPKVSADKDLSGKKHILVVDDDNSILALLKIILQKSGLYTVSVAHNGEEGLAVYQRESENIDLCLCDASMGAGMNGLDLCAAIRKINLTLPVILMSAYRAKEMSARMAESGVTTFLPKPFRGADVLEVCAKYVGQKG